MNPTPKERAQAKRAALHQALRALKHRNYRLFFLGHGISIMGTWIQRVAMGWLVYRLTGSEMILGVVAFSSHILSFFFTPIAGVVADRCDKRKMIVVTQSVAMVQAVVMAVLALGGWITVPQIIALSALLGLVSAFDVPIRQSFQIEIVDDREDLASALALNSILFNSSKLIGPSIAGLLIMAVGEAYCFLINALSYIAVIGSLMAMRVKPWCAPRTNVHPLRTLKDGLDYAFGSAPIRATLIQLTLSSLFGMGLSVLVPVFAKDILRGDADTMGILLSATGVGALLGTAYLATRKSMAAMGKMIAGGIILHGIMTIAFGVSEILWLSLILIAFSGFGEMMQRVSSNTLLQTIVDDDKRGRVMSLYAMSVMGTMPLGGLLAGTMAEHIGAPRTLIILGICCALNGLYFVSRLTMLTPLLHTLFVKRGVIREKVAAVAASTVVQDGVD